MANMIIAKRGLQGDPEDEDWFKLHMLKTEQNDGIVISRDDTKAKLFTISVNDDHVVRLELGEVSGETFEIVSVNGTRDERSPQKFVGDGDEGSNWRVEDDEFVVVLPKTQNEIRLPIASQPGPYTPEDDVHEIVGQGEMLFTVCLGIRDRAHTLLTGPTGVGKTSVYRWLAKKLNYNLVIMPVSRGTQDHHMRGEYAPVGPGEFAWTDGPVTLAARLSSTHPTLLVFDEMNRIGNVAEYARIYSLLDDTRMIELPEKRAEGAVERVHADQLFIGATMNPVDDDHGDYIGVKELDPALASRLKYRPTISYPDPETEARALCNRVEHLDAKDAIRMVQAATRVRESHDIRFPFSFRELEAWAMLLPHFGYADAAEAAVVSKAALVFQSDLRNLIALTDEDGARKQLLEDVL